MKKCCFILVFGMLTTIVNSSGLPPEHEVERLFLALKQSVEDADWPQATNQLALMRKLDVTQPADSFYYEGLVRVRSRDYHLARKVLEQYVVGSGHKGRYYEDALRLITEAENEEARVEGASSPQPSLELIESAQRDGYVKSLQALYLTQDPIEALVMQVNSLLSAHPYTGSRIKKSGIKEGLVYHVDVFKGGLTVQEKSYQNGAPMLSATSLQVPGLDPFIRASCSNREFACWLNHPSDKHKRWITIDYDELVVEELSEAMTKLLQSLQKDM